MLRRWIVCGVLATSSPLFAKPAPPAAAPAACVSSTRQPERIEVTGDAVSYCFERRNHLSCYATDLTTGKLTAIASPAPGTSTDQKSTSLPEVEVTDEALVVCRPGGKSCKTLRPRRAPDPGLGLTGAANDAGTLAALANLDRVETFDLGTGKRIASFKAGSKGYSCSHLEFAGDVLVVHHTECGEGGPSIVWLATRTGKRIALVGGRSPIDAATEPVHLAGTRWAFVSQRGEVVVIQDVATGKVHERIPIGRPAEEALPNLLRDGARLVIVFGGNRAGDVVVVDLATNKVSSYPAKRCAP